LLLILADDGALYIWDVASGSAPVHISHAFPGRETGALSRIDARWIARQNSSGVHADRTRDTREDVDEDEGLAVLVSSKKAGWQVVWPKGRPDRGDNAQAGRGAELTSTNHESEHEGDVSQDSLYDILTGRTPLPALKGSRVEDDGVGRGDGEDGGMADTGGLDDTFREKRVQAQAQQKSLEPVDLDDDSEIF